MPVAVLYCEGNKSSPDVRLIGQILPQCKVAPIGGKSSLFFRSIIADRRRNPNLACLVDRDFDCCDSEITNEPRQCVYEQVQVGWTWERKEIENYLLDPSVVQMALGKKAPPIDDYRAELAQAAETIAAYTAARTALACENFRNRWGEDVRKSYTFPRKLGKKSCETKIAEIVREDKGDRLIAETDILQKFADLLPKFRPDGNRYEQYLHYFAGKDLLYQMREPLRTFGFEPSSSKYAPEDVFIERILNRLERLPEIWTWLPEWEKLRALIEQTDFG